MWNYAVTVGVKNSFQLEPHVLLREVFDIICGTSVYS